MRKILLSIAIISLVAVVGVATTRAVFSDAKVLGGNTFATGTVTLGSISGIPITLTDMDPGVDYTESVSIEYTGSLTADLYFGVGSSRVNPLPPTDPRYLADKMYVRIYDTDTNSYVYQGYANVLASTWRGLDTDVSNGTTKHYNVKFKLDEDIENVHQGVTNTDTTFLFVALETGSPAPANPPYQADVSSYQAP